MASSFRNLLGLPVKDWDTRTEGQILIMGADKEHWEFADESGGGVGGGDEFAVASGTDTITATFGTAPTLSDGLQFKVRAAGANTTTSPTFNPNSLGALTLYKLGGAALAAGDISGAGHELIIRYRASPARYELVNPAGAWGGITGSILNQSDLQLQLASVGAFNPSTIYAGATKGFWFDFTDISTMWQDTAGTTPVTTVGQTVARIDDKSGLGFHATQSTSGKRAALGRDSDGTYHLVFTSGNYYSCGAAMASAAFSLVAVFNQTVDGGRIFDARGTGTTGTVKGFVLKGYNSSADRYFIIDDGAGHYMQGTLNPFGLGFKQLVSLRYGAGALYPAYNGITDAAQLSSTIGTVTPTLTNTLGIAANDLSSQPFVGKMYFVLGAGRSVKLPEMQGLVGYAASRTGF